MPKLKTHKGTAKRVKLTKTGKVLRQRAFKNHMLSKKSKSRKRRINTSATIEGSVAKNIKRALGVK
ncbi:50S ribosomal protein L35 [Chlamydia trachomatis]|jgi:ribosomal protein L35|uniref:Large ribosomal subunit protein bL35 n=1 Tax=Candidatus Nanogingivalis gingivitcus TaxID=2171992 RepID=A0ABY0FK14_9BACT|nr:50S ribosomal protein L35 [Candidatus Nanogingivalis gingivitcus]RYC72617.1 50S ribosomal protein L35 [Candidatus Nanogingivalis gingivitcus]CRH91129.1 50S ribosomal protein L35 [Chlamydia trachomatis]